MKLGVLRLEASSVEALAEQNGAGTAEQAAAAVG